MKKLIYSITALALALVVIVACSKDQKVVKQLDGTWTITAMTYDGVASPADSYAGSTYTFEKCKVKNEACPGSYTYTDPTKGAQTFPFTYTITEKGTKFTVTMTAFGITAPAVTSDIVESSKTKFVFSSTDEDGKITVTTLEKQ